MNSTQQDLALAREIALRASRLGGRVMFVGGYVRDGLLGLPCKDIDIEVYGLDSRRLWDMLCELGSVRRQGESFGVYALDHSNLDIAMPRREHPTGTGHRDFDVDVDPAMTFEQASRRRDFTINAMLRDVLTGELVDLWGGRQDLMQGIIRHVDDRTFPEDALRVFRAAQFAARLNASIAPETMALCEHIDVTRLSIERVFAEMEKALMKAERPSVYFRSLQAMHHLDEYFPELLACVGVEQNPVYHPEGDVFEHTMLVLDCAAALRQRAQWPLGFMISALTHDLGKVVATQRQPDGKITAYGHEVKGLPLCEAQLRRLTRQTKLIEYVKNMMWLHMRPNVLAEGKSKKKKTREMYDLSLCPEDLILLSRADASGKLDKPYDENNERFLRDRLEDYRKVMQRPMVTGKDLINAGIKPGPEYARLLARARKLHFSGLEKPAALKQILSEARRKSDTGPS